MQNENSRLKIHTSARPAPDSVREKNQEKDQKIVGEAAQGAARTDMEEMLKKVRWEPLPHPKQKKMRTRKASREARRREKETGEPLTVGEKLLRNTAVACALLLSVMALKNVDQPWSNQATEGIRQAMTMRIDWDDTLGKLSFVRALVPDTALVFLNLGGSADLGAPVNGEISHTYTEQQPWLEYRCAAGQAVCAAEGGTVTAAGQGAGDEWIVLIESEAGTEAVYGYLAAVYVQAGQTVERGQQIGVTAGQEDSRLYFELRENGESVDPSERMK